MTRKFFISLFFLLAMTFFSPLQASQEKFDKLFEKFQKLYHSGHHYQAVEVAREMVKVGEKTYGKNHALTGAAWNNLGQACVQIGKYKHGEIFLKEALGIILKSSPPPPQALSSVLNNLGELYRMKKDYKKSEKFYLQALSVDKKSSGLKHPHVASTISNMGLMYMEKGDYKRAREALATAISIFRDTVTLKDPRLGAALRNHARLLEKEKKFKKAEESYKAAFQVFYKAMGKDNYHIGITLRELGQMHFNQKKYKKAAQAARASSITMGKVFGKHPETADSLVLWGMILSRQKKLEEALNKFEMALEAYNKVLGSTHDKTIGTLEKLVGICRAMGKSKKLARYEEVLQKVLKEKYKK